MNVFIYIQYLVQSFKLCGVKDPVPSRRLNLALSDSVLSLSVPESPNLIMFVPGRLTLAVAGNRLVLVVPVCTWQADSEGTWL